MKARPLTAKSRLWAFLPRLPLLAPSSHRVILVGQELYISRRSQEEMVPLSSITRISTYSLPRATVVIRYFTPSLTEQSIFIQRYLSTPDGRQDNFTLLQQLRKNLSLG